MKSPLRLVFLSFLIVFINCQSNDNSGLEGNSAYPTLNVSAAASLKDVFSEIGTAFQKKFGKPVAFNFGASGTLQRQIETGAPVDVFASAGSKQMLDLAGKNLIDQPTMRYFARNSLVLIVPKNSTLKINAFADLTKNEVKKIAVGNPKTVPAGQYAEESLTTMNLQSSLAERLIFAENVRQVLDYVSRGETDAGIVYATDAQVMSETVRIVAAADENSHAPILYPIAIVRDTQNYQTAREFIEFVTGADGQNILQKYGFAPANEK